MQANLAALEVLGALRAEDRPATAEEQRVLARWGAWGAVPEVFDENRAERADLRGQLQSALTEEEYDAARRTTLNAHYTDPQYVQPIWDALTDLGHTGGEVLEPGCGSGTFIGLAPPGSNLTGVEMDPISAQIAQALYPGAQVRAESFVDTQIPAGHFDAAIGNVPFGDIALYDPQHNPHGHSIHNHFIVKSLHLVRPGGVAAFLTSRYTMDSHNPAARREIAQLADLVTAVRLPSGAHQRAAGTEAVTDLLVLRRRESADPSQAAGWERSVPIDLDDQQVRVNEFFVDHPSHVLGDFTLGHGMYSALTLNVINHDPSTVGAQLADVLTPAIATARQEGLGVSVRTEQARPLAPVAHAGPERWDGHLSFDAGAGEFRAFHAGAEEPVDVPRTRHQELRALLGLRDRARELLQAEAASPEDTPDIEDTRRALRVSYESYLNRYGPLNRITLRRTGSVDPLTGQDRTARVSPRVMSTFRTDPFAALVFALENYDEDTGRATPADVLSRRVVVPRVAPLGADSPAEALAITMDTTGEVDLDSIARLLGLSRATARQELGTLVFDEPGTDRLVPAAEYLSGQIADKLQEARDAAADEEQYSVNVTELEKVLPTPLGADEIEAKIAAAWIDTATHQQFLREILDDEQVTVEHPAPSIWTVRGGLHSISARSEWGTERVPAGHIFKSTLEQRPIQVTDDIGDGKRALNPVETEAAAEKQSAMQERFAEWIWEDPDRAARLTGVYNRLFNSLVLRDYSTEGQAMALPGLARTFTPAAHQRAAVARIVSEPAVGLFHEVGAGKTMEMVMGAMELRRLGMVNKPAVVVPNHMLEQFSREWLQNYPQARVLAASTQDLARDKRRQFVARVATNDWDAVIITRSAFERLPVSARTEAKYMSEALEQERQAVAAMKSSGTSVKRIEKKIAAEEERIKALRDSEQDAGLSFEESGIDYLMVDEMHDYKNLRTLSNIRDASIDGSKRATDLHLKLTYLRERHGERVVTAATATPIANSVTEAHVMQRFLRPDLLEAAGVAAFDSWAATFGQTATEIEMDVAGGFRQNTRFARFQNVPEMLRMWHIFADVQTAEDLQLPVPGMRERPDGQRVPEIRVLEPSQELTDHVQSLGDRAEAIRAKAVDSTEDNMLKVTTDGRKAALDTRLVGLGRAPGNKIEAASARMAAIWRENQTRQYHDRHTGEPAARLGGFQIVFCDLGTPRQEWNVYDELRDQLHEHGLPPGSVRFMHEANSDADKARLFQACRSGEVAVLVGSTQKMGVGTNIQDRAVALHHLDCPWRPADVQQREGRILRPGNQNQEVGIYRWVVEESFDGYSWQTVERKARFISQIMKGNLDVREIEDVGDSTLSYAEVKALASGNPLLIEREQAQTDVARYERRERAFHRNAIALQGTIDKANETIDRAEADIGGLEAAAHRSVDTTGDAFRATVNGRVHTDRADVATRLDAWASQAAQNVPALGRGQERDLGPAATIGGHTVNGALTRIALDGRPTVVFDLEDVPRSSWRVPLEDLNGQSLLRQIEYRIKALPESAQKVRAEADNAARDRKAAHEGLTRPFKHTEDLAKSRARLAEIDTALTAGQGPAKTAADPQPGSTELTDGDLAQRVTTLRQRAERQPEREQSHTHPVHQPPAQHEPSRGPRI